MEEKNWHSLPIIEVANDFNVSLTEGLSDKEAENRRLRFGLNKLPEKRKASNLSLVLSQLKSPLIYILLLAGVVTFIFGSKTDSLIIFTAVFINTAFGYWEEKKSVNVLDALKKSLRTKAVVWREKRKKETYQEYVVPGDVIVLSPGDKVPADARIFRANELKVSEAILTGEWLPVKKTTEPLSEKTPLAERRNMVFKGSLVEDGEGMAIVVNIGEKTEIGKIASTVRKTREEKTPLQKKLVVLGKFIGLSIAIACLFIFVSGIIEGNNPVEMFEVSVAIAVGGIPEALPVMMTIVLAIGMERLLRKKGLVRKLSSVETLGSTSVICFDKTRTLTKGTMEAQKIYSRNKNLLWKILTLCSDAFVENPKENPEKWKIKGSPTGKALFFGGMKNGFLKPEIEKKSKLISVLPFNSTRKYVLNLREENGEKFLYIIGAPEVILSKSKNKEDWQEKIEKMADEGLRVVAAGFKKVSSESANLDKEAFGFEFVGLVGLSDPLREGIERAVSVCQKAGLKPIIITGDSRKTAKTIANKAGFNISDEEIIEGGELNKLNEKDFLKIVDKIRIYARTEAKDKIKIIHAWQKKGEVVAMVGDGVNDAPAIKKADIGVALGSGTEAAKEASDLILLNDSFKIIIRAIEQGRVVLDNLRKSITYILSDSFASVILIGFATIIFGWPLPVLPAQILWNNFVEDTLPDIAYAFEPGEKGIMKRKPIPLKAPLLNKEIKYLIFFTGLIDQFTTLFVFWLMWKIMGLNLDYVRTIIFGSICLDTAFVVYSYKNLRKNIWKIKIFSNKWLVLSSIVVFVSFSAAVYIPFLQKILHTVSLGIRSWLFLVFLSLVSVAMIEGTKWFFITRKETE